MRISEIATVRISKDPNDLGAYVYDSGDPEPTVDIPISCITGVLEPDEFHIQKPGAQERIEKMVKDLKSGEKMPPILVRKYQNGYQVLDGHHRFKAYKLAGLKTIPVRIVDPENITGDIDEAWSNKYKRSIDCSNPKGFSQRAHCAARRKRARGEKTKSQPVREAIAPHGSPENELNMLKAGTKPAVLMYSETFDELYRPIANKMKWEVVKFNTGDQTHYVVAQPGQRQRAERIAKMVTDANKVFDTGKKISPEYHRELGTLLGYPKADIEHFIQNIYGDKPEQVSENFKDGKGPGRPGDSQRHGIPKNATIAQLEKAAKAPGRKGQLARWQLNMRRGRKRSLKETRQAALQWLKTQLPTWPDYVLRDWIYNLFKGEIAKDLDPNFELWKMLQSENMSADTKWMYVPDQKFTMSMWNPWTVDRLNRRAGGKIDPDIGVTRDAERHEMQKQIMAQQGGIRSEPIIMKETPEGYELIEGWHRTIQHFAKYPDGYTAPAWIAKM